MAHKIVVLCRFVCVENTSLVVLKMSNICYYNKKILYFCIPICLFQKQCKKLITDHNNLRSAREGLHAWFSGCIYIYIYRERGVA